MWSIVLEISLGPAAQWQFKLHLPCRPSGGFTKQNRVRENKQEIELNLEQNSVQLRRPWSHVEFLGGHRTSQMAERIEGSWDGGLRLWWYLRSLPTVVE